MQFNINEDLLLKEFGAISQKLLQYEELQAEINRKIDLTTQLVNSKAFEESIIKWGRTKPAEVIPFYLANKAGEENILSYGTLILSGIHFDFNGYFLKAIKEKELLDSTNYLLDNIITGERRFVSLREIVECYTEYTDTKKHISININSSDNYIKYPLIRNNVHLNSDGTAFLGKLEIDKLAKEKAIKIIESNFIIKEVSISDISAHIHTDLEDEVISFERNINSTNEIASYSANVVPLFRNMPDAL